jgi:hypothetical protein
MKNIKLGLMNYKKYKLIKTKMKKWIRLEKI